MSKTSIPSLVLLALAAFASCTSKPTAPEPKTVSPTHFHFHISPDSQRVKSLDSCRLVALIDSAASNYSIIWRFDDDSAVRVNVDSMTHLFTTLGQHIVHATYSAGSITASDSASVEVWTDPVNLNNYHQMVWTFVGDNVFKGDNTYDYSVWTGMDSVRVKGDSILYTYNWVTFFATSSNPNQAIDTFHYEFDDGPHHQWPQDYTSTEKQSAHNLPLMFSTSDSVCYGIIGPATSKYMNFYYAYQQTWRGTPMLDIHYDSTNWYSKKITPSFKVVFYR